MIAVERPGLILDPFIGSGSTAKAAVREGFRCIGIDQSAEYLAIAQGRIAHEFERHPLFDESTKLTATQRSFLK